MATLDGEASQPVLFTTQTAYPLPTQKFMIPAIWKRYQLSQLINKALSLTNPVPFDFLVGGEILRGSLADWCQEKGLGEVRLLSRFFMAFLLNCVGRNSRNRIHRVCSAPTKSIVHLSGRLGIYRVLCICRVSYFVHTFNVQFLIKREQTLYHIFIRWPCSIVRLLKKVDTCNFSTCGTHYVDVSRARGIRRGGVFANCQCIPRPDWPAHQTFSL